MLDHRGGSMRKEIGQCQRCERVSFRTEGACESGQCMESDGAVLQPVRGCEWLEREDEQDMFVCKNCDRWDDSMPRNISPIRACRAA